MSMATVRKATLAAHVESAIRIILAALLAAVLLTEILPSLWLALPASSSIFSATLMAQSGLVLLLLVTVLGLLWVHAFAFWLLYAAAFVGVLSGVSLVPGVMEMFSGGQQLAMMVLANALMIVLGAVAHWLYRNNMEGWD
ncbi:MAG: hypothetical protein R3292_00975 [Alcanivorax sp.]|nr:hypothetical protein [Alcanivorax sp.]